MAISKTDAFCELLKLAIDHAPDAAGVAMLRSLQITHCSGITAQGDSGHAVENASPEAGNAA